MRKLRALLVPSLLCCLSLTVHAQQPTPLVINTPVERTISTGQRHEFTVTLEKNSFVQFVVEQRGIDVVVKVFSPSGKNLGEFDTPNGDEGPEDVSFVASVAGNYIIGVSPLAQNNNPSGRYQIKILEQRPATDQEITSQNSEIVKEKGIALLGEMEGLLSQIKSPFTRINAQLQAGQLLLDSDPKRASKYLTDAANGVKELLASVDAASPAYPQQYSWIAQLRVEITRVLAQRDTDAALSFLYSSVPPPNPYINERDQSSQESMVELSIANQIIQKDPKVSLQIARRALKTKLSSNLLPIVNSLKRRNPELAAELANEMFSKVLNEKLLKDSDAANVAIGLLFYNGRLERPSSPPSPNSPQSQPPLLSDAQYRNLLQKALTEALSFTLSSPQSYSSERNAAWSLLNGLQRFGPTLDTVVPGSSAVVEKKLLELNAQGRGGYQLQTGVANGPVDTALEAIEKAPVDQRERLYLELANRESNSGDTTRARQIINERVTNAYQRRNALMNMDQQDIYRAITNGKVEEALRIISGFRTPKERASLVAQIAPQIGPGRKRATALNLLEQAKALLGPSVQAQDQDHMTALLEIARAFGRYDSKRSFEIVDPLIDQVNEVCAAARTLDGFGPGYYDEDELNLQNGSSVAQVVTRISNAVGTLAMTNFERSKAAADRLQLPEVRLRAYLDIAQQTITAAPK